MTDEHENSYADNTDEAIWIQKQVAYYQCLVSAWFENRMEKDKQVLALSVLSLGWMTTQHDQLISITLFALWISSILAYLTSIILLLNIFEKNSDHIGMYVNGISKENEIKVKALSDRLAFLTLASFRCFVIGITLTLLFFIIRSNAIDIQFEQKKITVSLGKKND